MVSVDLSRFFWIALVVSVVGLSFAASFNATPLIVFGFGIAPLVAYHLRLLADIKTGLSQSSIDSVYYFGFIVTIATLASTVLLIAARGGITKDITYVVNQFGLGLIATGYALFARMHLMAMAERLTASTPEQVIDEYIGKVKHVVEQVELSALQFENLTDTLIARTEQSTSASRAASETAMQSATHVFTESITKAGTEAKNSLNSIAASLGEVKFGTEVQELKTQIASMGSALGGISARLKTFEKAISAIEGDFSQASTAAGSLATNVQNVSANVEQVSKMSNELARLRQSFELVSQRADVMQKGLAGLDAAFARLVTDADRSLSQISASLETSSKLSAESVDRLADHLSKLVDFIISESKKKHATSV